MTNRPTPQSTPDTAAPAVPPLNPVGRAMVALAGVDPTDTAAVHAIVRDLSTRDRQSLVVNIGTSMVSAVAAIPAVLSAPTGPTPAEHVHAAISAAVDTLASLVLGARERGTVDVDPTPYVSTMVAAALARVAPDVDAATAAERAPRSRGAGTPGTPRNRRRVTRDWSGAGGHYRTPGRGDVAPSDIIVTISRATGLPSFSAIDPATGQRQTFSRPTPALALADGYTRDGLANGWASPFVALRDRDGNTLGDRAPEVPEPS